VRENALSKGRRYAAVGRLVVQSVTPSVARAVCRGDGAIYKVGFDNGRWSCDCPAFGRCSHQYALGLVTAFEAHA
jgi:uncharacterized Zn finger protein